MLTVYNFEAIFSRVIPSLVNFCLNLIIIRSIVKSRRNVANYGRSTGRATRSGGGMNNKDRHFAYSLIAQNFIFTAVTMPHVVLSGMQINEQLTDPDSANAALVNAMFSFGVWCSHAFEALPFLMNLGFNKMFRAELKDMYLIVMRKQRARSALIASLSNGSKHAVVGQGQNQSLQTNVTN
jgi:hypothetical protein